MVRVEVFGAPPFGQLGVPLMSGIGKRLSELLVSPRPADVFRRAAPRRLDQHGVAQRNDGERALDLDAVRPTVTEVVVVFEGFRAGVLDCRQERDLARIDRAIPPFLVGQTKTDVENLELVEMATCRAVSGRASVDPRKTWQSNYSSGCCAISVLAQARRQSALNLQTVDSQMAPPVDPESGTRGAEFYRVRGGKMGADLCPCLSLGGKCDGSD